MQPTMDTTRSTSALPEYSDEMIEKYRTINVDFDDWSTWTQDGFKERMEAIGIYVDRIYWSGFWSQGDGAMFEGWVQDWGKYLTHLGYTDDTLIETAINCWTFSWKQSGHYYHENSVSFDDGIYLPDNPYTNWKVEDTDEDRFRASVWESVMAQHDLLQLSEAIQEDLKDAMRDLYRALEDEYDSLTDDESVVEAMRANDIDPNELTDEEE